MKSRSIVAIEDISPISDLRSPISDLPSPIPHLPSLLENSPTYAAKY